MSNLDDIPAMNKLDPKGVLASTGMFPDQCQQAWEESSIIRFPEEYKKVKNVIVCGMGGSGFTPKTIKELFHDEIKVPYEKTEEYTLPGYVNEDTLVIISSFSGTTEEPISCAYEALKRGAKVTAIAQGGKVAEILKTNNLPGYIFNPKFNPCGQPRIGGGYLLMGHMGILKALGLLEITNEEVQKAIEWARSVGQKFKAEIPSTNNPAKQLAQLLKDKHPFIITAEFLRGFGNGFANQINETAKMISDYRYISELNHHLMEGLKRPDSLHQNGLFLFIMSNFYHPSIQKRFLITKDVVEKQSVKTQTINMEGPDKLSQVLEAYTLSGYTTFYMAMLYDTDPVAIPWVDYFKAQLATV